MLNDKIKVNHYAYYEILNEDLPIVEITDIKVFQQDGVPAHTTKTETKCQDEQVHKSMYSTSVTDLGIVWN